MLSLRDEIPVFAATGGLTLSMLSAINGNWQAAITILLVFGLTALFFLRRRLMGSILVVTLSSAYSLVLYAVVFTATYPFKLYLFYGAMPTMFFALLSLGYILPPYRSKWAGAALALTVSVFFVLPVVGAMVASRYDLSTISYASTAIFVVVSLLVYFGYMIPVSAYTGTPIQVVGTMLPSPYSGYANHDENGWCEVEIPETKFSHKKSFIYVNGGTAFIPISTIGVGRKGLESRKVRYRLIRFLSAMSKYVPDAENVVLVGVSQQSYRKIQLITADRVAVTEILLVPKNRLRRYLDLASRDVSKELRLEIQSYSEK